MSFLLLSHKMISLILERLAAKIFSLIPPTGKYLPTECDFSRHRKILLDSFLRQQEIPSDVKDGYSRTGAVFGGSPLWNMDVDVVFIKLKVMLNQVCCAFALMYSIAMVKDSFIIFPRFPVMLSVPFPGDIAPIR